MFPWNAAGHVSHIWRSYWFLSFSTVWCRTLQMSGWPRLHMVSWFSACKNPVAVKDGCQDQCCRDHKKISQWADIPCERMLFLAALILLSRVGQTRLVSLFPWIGRSTSIFHGSVDLNNTQLMSLLNISGVIYILPWTVCSPNIDWCATEAVGTNVVSVNILASTR